MNKYHIRYNTHSNGIGQVWRIFENGNELLVENFRVLVPVFGEQTIENGVIKWNVSCNGTMKIIDGVAIIE